MGPGPQIQIAEIDPGPRRRLSRPQEIRAKRHFRASSHAQLGPHSSARTWMFHTEQDRGLLPGRPTGLPLGSTRHAGCPDSEPHSIGLVAGFHLLAPQRLRWNTAGHRLLRRSKGDKPHSILVHRIHWVGSCDTGAFSASHRNYAPLRRARYPWCERQPDRDLPPEQHDCLAHASDAGVFTAGCARSWRRRDCTSGGRFSTLPINWRIYQR